MSKIYMNAMSLILSRNPCPLKVSARDVKLDHIYVPERGTQSKLVCWSIPPYPLNKLQYIHNVHSHNQIISHDS